MFCGTTSHATLTFNIRSDTFFVKTPIIKHADINPIFLEPIFVVLMYCRTQDRHSRIMKQGGFCYQSILFLVLFAFILLLSLFFPFWFFVVVGGGGALFKHKTNDIIFAVT